eukprot:scaffold4814_cov22-Tisochrysis_lutea.AAC.4
MERQFQQVYGGNKSMRSSKLGASPQRQREAEGRPQRVHVWLHACAYLLAQSCVCVCVCTHARAHFCMLQICFDGGQKLSDAPVQEDDALLAVEPVDGFLPRCMRKDGYSVLRKGLERYALGR